jgi:hypothetical protein
MLSGAALWQGGLRVLGSGILAALVTGIGWWAVNPMMIVKGAGLLERQGWPWNSVLLCMAGGAAVGAAGACWSLYRGRQRAREVREMCWSLGLGFTYAPAVAREDVPQMPLFKRWSAGRYRVAGKWDGMAVEMFDFTPIAEEGGTDGAKTVVLLPAADLPPFDLRPRTAGVRFLAMLGVEGITFDPAGLADPGKAAVVAHFNELFYLTPVGYTPAIFPDAGESTAPSADEQAIRRLFTVAVMEVLVQNPGWSIQSHGGHLAFWQGERVRPPSGWPELMAAALAIREALVEARTTAASETGLPSRPPRPARIQAARVESAILGGLAGSLLGFFVGAAGSSAVFFQRPFGAGLASRFLLEGAIFFGSVLAGAGLGALVGSRFPFRRPTPSTGESPEDPGRKAWRLRITGAGVGIGLIVGFFGGLSLAFAIDEALAVKLDLFWITPMLTFSGMGLGAFSGAVLGGSAANRLARRLQRSRSGGESQRPTAVAEADPAGPPVGPGQRPARKPTPPLVKGTFVGAIGTCCTLVGTVFLIFASTMGAKSWRLTDGALRTEGTVIRMERSLGQEGLAPVVRYRVDGKEHEVTSQMHSSPAAYTVGEKVTVLYQPGQPDVAGIDSFFDLWFSPLLFGGVGLVAVGVAVGAFFVVFRRQKGKTQPISATEGATAPEGSG